MAGASGRTFTDQDTAHAPRVPTNRRPPSSTNRPPRRERGMADREVAGRIAAENGLSSPDVELPVQSLPFGREAETFVPHFDGGGRSPDQAHRPTIGSSAYSPPLALMRKRMSKTSLTIPEAAGDRYKGKPQKIELQRLQGVKCYEPGSALLDKIYDQRADEPRSDRQGTDQRAQGPIIRAGGRRIPWGVRIDERLVFSRRIRILLA